MGLSGSLGGAVIESSVLYEVINFLDRGGNFDFASKHQKGLDEVLTKAGYYFEPYSNVEISFYKL